MEFWRRQKEAQKKPTAEEDRLFRSIADGARQFAGTVKETCGFCLTELGGGCVVVVVAAM